MIADDRAFVVSGWSATYRTSPHAGLLPMPDYAAIMHPIVNGILDHPTTRVIVAEQPGETDHEERAFLYGFIVFAASPARYVYYLFVKGEFRRGETRYELARGFGRQLMAAAGIDPARAFEYACHTSDITELRDAGKLPHATFNPMPARFLHVPEEEQRARRRHARR